MEAGRTIFLVDYPQIETGLSAEDVERMNLRASIIPYTAEQVINWKTDIVGGRKMLTSVVIAEHYLEPMDEFDHTQKIQYRVLRLKEQGYSQQS